MDNESGIGDTGETKREVFNEVEREYGIVKVEGEEGRVLYVKDNAFIFLAVSFLPLTKSNS